MDMVVRDPDAILAKAGNWREMVTNSSWSSQRAIFPLLCTPADLQRPAEAVK